MTRKALNECDLFMAALEIGTPEERSAFLDESCGSDAKLRRRLEALLESSKDAGSFLEQPALVGPDTMLDQGCGLGNDTPAESNERADAPRGETSLDFLSPTDQPGHLGKLDHYDVLELIGSGGMGIVLKAFDEKLHRVVALKVMAPQWAGSATARKRFIREAQAAAAVRNEHVIAIYAVEEGHLPAHVAGVSDPGYRSGEGGARRLPYLAMEYIFGPSLQDRLDAGGPLELKEILRIGQQTACGLAAAHAQGLIHRDIKPANILLETLVASRGASAPGGVSAPGGRVKITDFGLARAVDDASGISQSSVVAGTPQYMAPEQARGEHLDHRADLFSLGSVLYALCTGRAPFRAEGAMAVLKRVCDDSTRPIQEINDKIPDWLVAIVDKLHAKEPAERYQTAAEVAEVLGGRLAQLQQPSQTRSAELGTRNEESTQQVSHSAFRIPRSALKWAAALLVVIGGLALSEILGVTQLSAFLSTRPVTSTDGGNPPETGLNVSAGPSPLDQLDPAKIPAEERFAWQPKELVAVLGEHRGKHWGSAGSSVALSPDGKWLASPDYTDIILWDPETLRERGRLKGHSSSVYTVVFAADSRRLLSRSIDRTLRLWDVQTGKELRRINNLEPYSGGAAVSSDGRWALTGHQDKTVRLWDLETETLLHRCEGHADQVYCVAFSPDGRLAVSGGRDGLILLWDPRTGKELRRFEGSPGAISALVFSPDGRRLLSGNYHRHKDGKTERPSDNRLRLWDVDTGKEVRRFDEGGMTYVVAFSPDGRQALSGGPEADSLRLWDVDSGTEIARIGNATWGNVGFFPDGRRAFSADPGVRLWDLETRQELNPRQGHPYSVQSLAFSPNGRFLLSGGLSDPYPRLWDTTTGTDLGRFEGNSPGNHLDRVAWCPDGCQVLSIGRNAGVPNLRLWDVETGKDLQRFKKEAQGYGVVSIAVTPDGRYALTPAGNGIDLWDLQRGEVTNGRFEGHTAPVTSLAVSPDGRRVVSGSQDKTVRLWDLDSGRELLCFGGVTSEVRSLAFAPDGRWVAAGEQMGMRLWDVAHPERPVFSRGFYGSRDRQVAFAPNGKTLASAGNDGLIVLWEVPAGNQLHEWQLPGPVTSLAFAPDGRHLATGNANGTIYILRLKEAEK